MLVHYNCEVLVLKAISNVTVVEHQSDIKRVVDQLKSDIDHIAQETKHLKNGERLSQLRKINGLRQIVSSLEDIDTSLDTLLQRQFEKHPIE